ncbi:MAG: NERD domain-containing protein [Acidimicrobiaceae bacterium]|nr:NERD domain-containing protein [Acidimicrobiaceae bacterium]MYG56353.1 NERD domain-containing protein [Acidimicrobiaceae bacterium]MYJ98733.1 NERD domain-containing protein [Acidimicrobiaceae bacterium]
MIVKPYERTQAHKDPRQRAGSAAERQMAHYLNRTFSGDESVFVLHGLRFEDRDQPEQDGSHGVCQIDHLVVHRWGLFVVESKSVTEEVRIRSDGSDGDEWSRIYKRKEQGMPSPLRQARRQSDFLRAFLQRHREDLLGRQPVGLRTITRVVVGTDQRGFANAPIQQVIAVSDEGRIKRVGGWKEPREPFRAFVAKADLVPAKITKELEVHRRCASLTNPQIDGDYGKWAMAAAEAKKVAEFLAERHTNRTGKRSDKPDIHTPASDPAGTGPEATERSSSRSRPTRVQDTSASDRKPAQAACKQCGSNDLEARSGRYGYYWKCHSCDKNTSMPQVCSACAAKRPRVRVRKAGKRYFRDCDECGTSETIWTER